MPLRTFSSTSLPSRFRTASSKLSSTGQQLLEQTLGGSLHQRGLLAHDALAVVLEVGLQAPGRVEQVVTLALQRREIDLELRGFRGTRVRFRTRGRVSLVASVMTDYALCWSSSMISASATSSSDGCDGVTAHRRPPTAAPARSGTAAA